MMTVSLTLNEFGWRWFLGHAGTWSQARGRRIRRCCLCEIMPSLGSVLLSRLDVGMIQKWLNDLVLQKSAVTGHLAACTLLELLEAAVAKRLVSTEHISQWRAMLSYPAVAARYKRDRPTGDHCVPQQQDSLMYLGEREQDNETEA